LAAKQPWRMALSYLIDAYGENYPIDHSIRPWRNVGQKKFKGVSEMINQGVNSPLASSCGRLFDAVSFLAGVAPAEMEFEAEAPMRLESVAADGPVIGFGKEFEDEIRKTTRTDIGKETSKERRKIIGGRYRFCILEETDCPVPTQISFAPMIKAILKDLGRGIPASVISVKFHNTLAQVILAISEKARLESGINTVVLAGGVFLNKRLLVTGSHLLELNGFTVLRPLQYSPNDESISVGQIAYALHQLQP